MRYRFDLGIVAGEESRFLLSSRPFTALRRYSECVAPTTDSLTKFHEQLGPAEQHYSEYQEGTKSLLEVRNNLDGMASDSNVADGLQQILQRLEDGDGYKSRRDFRRHPIRNALITEHLYEDELTSRLDHFGETTLALRSEGVVHGERIL